jgi:hypothetical protein
MASIVRQRLPQDVWPGGDSQREAIVCLALPPVEGIDDGHLRLFPIRSPDGDLPARVDVCPPPLPASVNSKVGLTVPGCSGLVIAQGAAVSDVPGRDKVHSRYESARFLKLTQGEPPD